MWKARRTVACNNPFYQQKKMKSVAYMMKGEERKEERTIDMVKTKVKNEKKKSKNFIVQLKYDTKQKIVNI